MGAAAIRGFRVLTALLQRAGPYVLLELLLPGGTLFALLLFLYQRRAAIACAPDARRVGVIANVLGKVRSLDLAARTLRLVAAPTRGCSCDGLEPLSMASVHCACRVRMC